MSGDDKKCFKKCWRFKKVLLFLHCEKKPSKRTARFYRAKFIGGQLQYRAILPAEAVVNCTRKSKFDDWDSGCIIDKYTDKSFDIKESKNVSRDDEIVANRSSFLRRRSLSISPRDFFKMDLRHRTFLRLAKRKVK